MEKYISMNRKDIKKVNRLDKLFLVSSVIILIAMIAASSIALIYLSNNLFKAFSNPDPDSDGDAINFKLEEYKELDLPN